MASNGAQMTFSAWLGDLTCMITDDLRNLAVGSKTRSQCELSQRKACDAYHKFNAERRLSSAVDTGFRPPRTDVTILRLMQKSQASHCSHWLETFQSNSVTFAIHPP